MTWTSLYLYACFHSVSVTVWFGVMNLTLSGACVSCCWDDEVHKAVPCVGLVDVPPPFYRALGCTWIVAERQAAERM